MAKNKYTRETFIKKAEEIHGGKYCYDNLRYTNTHGRVIITCPTHGDFEQFASSHLQGFGCKKCATDSQRKTKEDFISEANIVHQGKYSYDKVEYVDSFKEIVIICPSHGDFLQRPYSHLQGHGCSRCSAEMSSIRFSMTKDEFLKRANEIHGGKYDYSKVDYNSMHEKICIICPTHGEFWQMPYKHLNRADGCRLCNSSHLENELAKLFDDNCIEYNREFREDWLGRQSLDFYVPSKKIAVECQGVQHFKSVELFGGESSLKETIDRDKLKKQLCEEHGVKLLYFSNLGIEYPYEVIEDKEELLSRIMNDN